MAPAAAAAPLRPACGLAPAHRKLQHAHLLAPPHQRDVAALLRHPSLAQRDFVVALRHTLHRCARQVGRGRGWGQPPATAKTGKQNGPHKDAKRLSSTAPRCCRWPCPPIRAVQHSPVRYSIFASKKMVGLGSRMEASSRPAGRGAASTLLWSSTARLSDVGWASKHRPGMQRHRRLSGHPPAMHICRRGHQRTFGLSRAARHHNLQTENSLAR